MDEEFVLAIAVVERHHSGTHALKAYEPCSGASYARLPCYEQNEQT